MEQFVILYIKKRGCHVCKDLDRLLPMYHHQLLMKYPRGVFHLLSVNEYNHLLQPHPFPRDDVINPLLIISYPLFVFISLSAWEQCLEGTPVTWSEVAIMDMTYNGKTWIRQNQRDIFQCEQFIQWITDCLQSHLNDHPPIAPPAAQVNPQVAIASNANSTIAPSAPQVAPPVETILCKATNPYHHRLRFKARIAKTRCYVISKPTDSGSSNELSK